MERELSAAEIDLLNEGMAGFASDHHYLVEMLYEAHALKAPVNASKPVPTQTYAPALVEAPGALLEPPRGIPDSVVEDIFAKAELAGIIDPEYLLQILSQS